MAYTSDKKPGALTQATVLANTDNVVVEQSGDVKKATLSQVEAKIFDSKTATSTPTGTEVTVIRLTDGNLRQVALSNIVPVGNITDAKISDTAEIADTKLATIATAGKVLNSATTATPDNDINAIVTRDGSGNFSAGTITATLAGSITGNAATATTANTATTLATGRTIALTGDVTGTTGTFNGSANVTAATTIANNAVTTAKIADANVTTAKIADASVTTAKIADLNVTTAKIANGNVTTAKIADSNVTNAKLATDIDAGKLTAGTLPIARIADGAVTNAKLATDIDAGKLTAGTLPIARIADGAVTNAKLASGIDAGKLTTGTLPADRIGSNAITTAKIANGNVTNNKLTLGANAGEIKKALNADNAPPIFACRAWVLFNGRNNANGVASSANTDRQILAAGNVSSVTKVSSGLYRITFTIPMPSVHYCFTGGGDNDETNSAISVLSPQRQSFLDDLKAESCTFRITSTANNNRNPNRCSVMFFA